MLAPSPYNNPDRRLGRLRSTPLFDAYALVGLIGVVLALLQPLKLSSDPSPGWILAVEFVGLGLAGALTFYLYMQMPAQGGRRYTLHFLAVFGTSVFIVSVPEYWFILLFAVIGYLAVGLYLGHQWRTTVTDQD